jgi:hypothetical protein
VTCNRFGRAKETNEEADMAEKAYAKETAYIEDRDQ